MSKQPLHILVATGLYPPEIGGPATYVRMLEDKLDHSAIEIAVVPFMKVRHLPKVLRHIVFLYLLIKGAKGKDAIYALDPVSVGVPAYVASLCTRKPFFVRMAGDYAWEQAQLRFGVRDPLAVFYKKRFSYGFFVSILSYIESFITRQADLVILPCEYLRKIMEVWKVDQGVIRVVYSGLFPLVVKETKEAIRMELGYTGTVIVSAGRLVPNKGFLGLIEAFGEMAATTNDIHLVIIGEGPQEAELKTFVETKGLQSHVTFTGMLPKAQLGKAIKGADLFVLNTEHEGFSHQLLEVMDLGVPVVATAVGGNPELVIDRENGLLVPFNDRQKLKEAMHTLITDTVQRDRYIENAKARTKLFDQEKLAAQITSILEDNCRRA